jgi:uncharacterized tellurite resistance protein B-like protein
MGLDSFRAFVTRHLASAPEGPSPPADPVRIAACALLLELAHADGDFSVEERERVARAAREMGVAASQVEETLELAEAERRGSVDLYGFTRRVAESLSRDERLRLLEAVWGVVYSDGSLTEAENRLARRVAELLGFQHPEVQAVKEKVAARAP